MDIQKLTPQTDDRGTLVEAFKLQNDGQVFYVLVKPGESRGNHYHLRKTETFIIAVGSATISVRDRETGNLMKIECNGVSPMAVKVTPNHTHNVVAGSDGCMLIVLADEQYDDKDNDTYREEI